METHLHDQNRASWNKSTAGVSHGSYQAEIRMRFYRVFRLDGNKPPNSQQDLMQVDCQGFFYTSWMQIVSVVKNYVNIQCWVAILIPV